MLRMYHVECDKLENRLIFLGGYSSMCTYPFRITDFQVFGNIKDICRYYDIPEKWDRLELTSNDKKKKNSQYLIVLSRTPCDSFFHMCNLNENDRKSIQKRIGRLQDPESFIVQSYYERVVLERELKEEDDYLMHYWKFLKNCAIFIDSDELIFFWNKYGDKYINMSSNVSDGGLTHSVWLSIYNSDENLL